MNRIISILSAAFLVLFFHLVLSCNDDSLTTSRQSEKNVMVKKKNPVIYFEIPVNDINRAIKFYTNVFKFDFDKEVIDKNEMALFPFSETNSGISGALAKGSIYKPSRDGVLIYFNTEDIEETLKLATTNGARILYPKTDNGIGLVAEFEDTEGNRIALFQSKELMLPISESAK